MRPQEYKNSQMPDYTGTSFTYIIYTKFAAVSSRIFF